MVVQRDWTTLHGICFEFQRHCKKEFSDAARVMNKTYSNEITDKDFQSLFTDDTRSALKPDAFTLLKDLIKKSITADATKTEPSHRSSFVTRLVDAVPFSYSRHGSEIKCKLRTLNNFKKLLNYSCDHPELFAYIEIGIDDLYFTYDFLPRNLAEVSFDDVFDPGPGASASPSHREEDPELLL